MKRIKNKNSTIKKRKLLKEPRKLHNILLVVLLAREIIVRETTSQAHKQLVFNSYNTPIQTIKLSEFCKCDYTKYPPLLGLIQEQSHETLWPL